MAANHKHLHRITSRRQTGPVRLPDDARPRLPQLAGIRAVVFDVYGTLFSSGVGDISLATEENRDAALRTTLAENGLKLMPGAQAERLDDLLHDIIHTHQAKRRSQGVEYPEVEIREVWKDFIQTLIDRHFLESGKPVDLEALVIDYESRINPTQPMPGLPETLAALRQFGPLSIISNAQFYTPLLFEAFLGQSTETLGFCSACNVWSYAELEGKPSRRLYELAAQKLAAHHSLRPEDCLYVGNDMRNDIWPAREVGFRTALFAGDRLSLRRRPEHPACKGLEADAEITELAQILQLL
ncbi:MAG: HAD family hydrolase [Opitutales bacterium]